MLLFTLELVLKCIFKRQYGEHNLFKGNVKHENINAHIHTKGKLKLSSSFSNSCFKYNVMLTNGHIDSINNMYKLCKMTFKKEKKSASELKHFT